MMNDIYVREKLRELEAERLSKLPPVNIPASTPPAAPFLRGTGRLLRRLGERLECWASPQACEAERQPVRLDGRAR